MPYWKRFSLLLVVLPLALGLCYFVGIGLVLFCANYPLIFIIVVLIGLAAAGAAKI